MPIRTHRGRTAVYRRLWGWPVRSPKHLAGTMVALVAIGVGLGQALPDDQGASAGPTISAGRKAGANSLASPPRSALAEAGIAQQPAAPFPSAPAPAAALTVARSWVNGFLTVPKGITPARWVEQLRPYTTDDLFPQLQSINPANVPTAQIIEAPRTVSAGASSAEVDVPTTAVVVRLLLVSTPAGWRVASYERAG
ncbi:MAG: hypothetical protein DLM61_26050 [Pseudonocardiales bacterium]|nr:MAG: hypothetical protein DLM61_26050 [Pseudonocardiales bacterium]